MSEAKPQDGSTVKGYRTLTDGDIERMNRLKVSAGIFAVCSIQSEVNCWLSAMDRQC